MTRRGLETARRYGLETTVYTVNDEDRIAELGRSRGHGRLYGLSGSSTGSPWPSSGRLISFAPSDGIRAIYLSALPGEPLPREVDMSAIRLVPLPVNLHPRHWPEERLGSVPLRRTSSASEPFVWASSSSDSGLISTSTRSPFCRPRAAST